MKSDPIQSRSKLLFTTQPQLSNLSKIKSPLYISSQAKYIFTKQDGATTSITERKIQASQAAEENQGRSRYFGPGS
jgi:hypothetical protein